jgi:tRNA (Thr-GGU) A37 N-methylase
MESLQRIAFLQEKLAEKEKNEVQLIEEKNKLLNIVKEYNDSLTNERDSLRDKIFNQDETIKVQ